MVPRKRNDERLADMQRDFPDELLSALIDDELTPEERAKVEQHLATCEADRQLLAELKSLRSEMAALPPVEVRPNFTDRVVQAALAAAGGAPADASAATSAPVPARGRMGLGQAIAVVLGAVAVAAAVLLFFRPRSHGTPDQPGIANAVKTDKAVPPPASEPSVEQQIAAALRAGDAVVLRVHAAKDIAFDAVLNTALGQAGISPVPVQDSDPRLAADLILAYRKSLDPKKPGTAAAEAVLIEAPREQAERAVTALARSGAQQLGIRPEGFLPVGSSRDAIQVAEGEPGSATKSPLDLPSQAASARRLKGELFPLPEPLPGSTVWPFESRVGELVSPQQPVRVLILVEQPR